MSRKLKNQELPRLSVTEFKQASKTPVVLILDNIRSLNNIGSVFRTADAFLLEKIFLCGITAIPPNKDIRKTALGATESVAWEYREDTLGIVSDLQRQGYKVLAVEQTEGAEMLDDYQVRSTDRYALIFGNEVKGVHQPVVNASNGVVEIPQFGTKHSLNISVSVGVVVWYFWSNLKTSLANNLI